MTTISKELFDRHVGKNTPCNIAHPWTSSCVHNFCVIALNVLIGSVKFFGPIYVLKLILNWKRINKSYVKNVFIGYLRSLVYGSMLGNLFFSSFCVFGKVNITYYNVMVCGFVAGLSILVESEENKMLNTLLFFNQVLEGGLNILTSKNIIVRTRFGETLAFMIISSVLMHLFKTQKTQINFTHLWFYPAKSIYGKAKRKSEKNHCDHQNTCFQHAAKGSAKYFCMGYILEIVKRILSGASRLISKPRELPSVLINRKNVLFGLLFGGYVFLYRYITCYLIKEDKEELPSHALLAGFIAGTAYSIRPNIQIPIIGVTTILQLLWQRLSKNYNLPQTVPYYLIIFSLATGVLIHFRFLLSNLCPKYTRNMLSAATNTLVDTIIDNFYSMIIESEKFLQAKLSKA